MNKLLLPFLIFTNFAFAQDNFSNCSAVFLNDQLVVEEYSDVAKAKISKEAKGWISAGTIIISDDHSKYKKFEITKKFRFGVAIKDGNTGTMILFSSKTFKKIEIQKVLAKCKKGDSVIIMTNDDEYALPLNNLLVY